MDGTAPFPSRGNCFDGGDNGLYSGSRTEARLRMTLHLAPEVAAGLKALASARGLTVEEYLKQLVNREVPAPDAESAAAEGTSMVWENGLLVYRTGNPLPAQLVDDAIRRSREERSQRTLGDPS
jgi:hypothetical protein